MSKTAEKREAARKSALDTKAASRKQAESERTAKRAALVAAKKALSPAQQKALEAKVALDAEEKETARACLEEVLAVCKRHGCRLHARPITLPSQGGYFVLAAEPLISTVPGHLQAEAPTE